MKDVAVVGLGGTGSWTAFFLSFREDIRFLYLYDSDVVEWRNIKNRGLFRGKDVGKKKVDVVISLINERNPYLNVIGLPHVKGLPLLEVDEVYDCTDKMSVHKALFQYCKHENIELYRVSYDGFNVTVGRRQQMPLIASSIDEADRRGYTEDGKFGVSILASAMGITREIVFSDDARYLASAKDLFCKIRCPRIEEMCDECPKCDGCNRVPDGYGYCDDCEEKCYPESCSYLEKKDEEIEELKAQIEELQIGIENLQERLKERGDE